jgi:hypothetical protein
MNTEIVHIKGGRIVSNIDEVFRLNEAVAAAIFDKEDSELAKIAGSDAGVSAAKAKAAKLLKLSTSPYDGVRKAEAWGALMAETTAALMKELRWIEINTRQSQRLNERALQRKSDIEADATFAEISHKLKGH